MRLFCSHLEHDHLFLQQRTLKKNEVLHHARDKFTHLYAIRQGALKSRTSDYQGIERIHHLYLKDEIYGFDGIYNAYYPYETIAMCPTVVCEMSYPYFLELMHHNTQLLETSLQLMSQQLTANHYLQRYSAQQKVAAFLLDLAKRLHKLENELMVLPLVYQDIGNYLNLAPETISRVLAKFKQSNIISLSKKTMQILNSDKLKELTH
jgi:CRP/FNR family transcriptional regulator, anaerobic regulatory protein